MVSHHWKETGEKLTVPIAFWDSRNSKDKRTSFRTKMADEVVNETLSNLTAAVNETAKNATGRAAATPEGLLTAYCSLIIMALVPIFFGSFRSVKCVIRQKVSFSYLSLIHV